MQSSVQQNQISGELASIIATYTEVTERLKSSHDKLTAEVARLRKELEGKDRQLQRRSRLAALGEMAAGIAHEIRNPLGGIALYADLLNSSLADRPKDRGVSQKISSAVKGLDAIVCDVLAFAGEIDARPAPVCLGDMVNSALAIVSARYGENLAKLDVKCNFEQVVNLDKNLLVRVLSNLLNNAADAAGSGHVRLKFEKCQSSVVLEVCDSGSGISAEAQERIFNPFYTTRSNGTGLGLAIVHRIVESHDGSIMVDNAAEPDGLGGARFKIVLPQ